MICLGGPHTNVSQRTPAIEVDHAVSMCVYPAKAALPFGWEASATGAIHAQADHADEHEVDMRRP